MTLAFVLLNVETGKEPKVIQDLREIYEVTATYLIYGVYDVIARVEAGNPEELKDVIGSKIRKIENIRSSLTLIATQ
jgi:DNA-binding Lrp family transcriptional regulator